MNLSQNTAETRYTPHTYSLHQHLAKYEPFLLEKLGPLEDRVMFESGDVPYGALFMSHFMSDIKDVPNAPNVESVTIPGGIAPRMKLTSTVKPTLEQLNVSWDLEWRDTPVAIKFKDCTFPVVYVTVDFVVGTSSYEMTKTILVVNKSEVKKVLVNLETAFKRTSKFMEVVRGSSVKLPEDGYRWDRVVLHPDTSKLVKDDFEMFIQIKEWFALNDLPYRRGYLFYGPPGNGKTSAIRVMASHPLVSAFTIDMGNPDVTNADITELFSRAANRPPALVVLEDIDRMFAKQAQEEERRKVTLQHLLNCLDGISSPEGTIVVATANEPSDLDPALLKRPGRFDRVVEFKSPANEQRTEYFRRRHSLKLTESESQQITEKTAGFTFAQLREAYIISGQNAFSADFNPKVTITFDQLVTGIEQIRDSLKNISKYKFKKGAGFEERPAGFSKAIRRQNELA